MNPVTALFSNLTGVPEPTLRLLFTVLLGYPAAYNYRNKFIAYNVRNVAKSTESQRAIFLLGWGVFVNFFFNGFKIYHSAITITASWAFCHFIGEGMNNRKLAAACVWVFNALYLLIGYYFTQTDDYDIGWTMTQCILCLRMMGFGFDYYDGGNKENTENKVDGTAPAAQKIIKTGKEKAMPLSFGADTPLAELPSLEQVFSYALFPSAFLVGPQFSFSLFKKWLNDTWDVLSLEEKAERRRARNTYVRRCALLAVAYLGFQQTVGTAYSTSYLLTEEYSSFGYLKRLFIFAVAGKLAYNKYIGIWLLTEGATAGFGISYEGRDKEGRDQFKGLANAQPLAYETATSIDNIISAFNINTNLWSKYYVFKRLKFLNNIQLSQLGTLFFLAIWHGFHIMYFITFTLEFLFVECEKVLRKRFVPMVQPYTKKNELYAVLWKAASWLACHLCITYAVVGFELLGVGKSWRAYKKVGFIGHLAIVAILGADKFFPRSKVEKKKA